MKNSIKILQTGCLVLVTGLFVLGQEVGMTRLSTDEGSLFVRSGNWKSVQRVLLHPEKADFLKTEAGNGILLGTTGATAQTNLGMGDLLLKLEFMLAPNSEAVVQLPSGHSISLKDSWQNPKLDALTSGGVGNVAPLQNANKAPGLWQTLQIQLRKPRVGMAAQIEQMLLNGVLVQENTALPMVSRVPDNSLGLEVKKGTVAFKKIYYQLLNDTKPLSLSKLSYQLYKDGPDKAGQFKPENLLKKDTTSVLTQEWGVGNNNYTVEYEGKMNVEQSGLYLFQFAYMNEMRLEIDNKTVLPMQWSEFSQKLVAQTVSLAQGEHTFRLRYHRVWRPASMGIFVSTQGVRPYALHLASSLPDPDPMPTIVISANQRPEMVRSFILMEGETQKRTHCLSVGSAQGLHYTLDLNRGSLLQFWKGTFADVTEMWFERGEPQLLKPLGLTLVTKGQTDVAPLTDNNAAWPDSTLEIAYKGYRLDAAGNPAVKYTYSNAELTDAILPAANGLTRTLTVNGAVSVPLYMKLATGSRISQIEKGLYEINDQQYFVRTDPKLNAIVRSQNNQQELLLPIGNGVQYTLVW